MFPDEASRTHNGWTWTGITFQSKWRFRKTVSGKTVTADVASSAVAGAVQAALDAQDALMTPAPASVTK